jgi:hypothetical protein
MIDKKMKRYLEDVEVLEKTIIKINETNKQLFELLENYERRSDNE